MMVFDNIWAYFNLKFDRMMITAKSLFYNEHLNSSYVGDILMEPIFWFVDNFTVCLGPFFIVAVIGLTTSVIMICLLIGLPYWLNKSTWGTLAIVVIGLWLLSNVLFHYYMGCTVHPGKPPEGVFIQEAYSICKKCIAPKPPRTHHCSVCNKCILKMDHHCPWLNNCVGFWNHRHFFLYMAYTTLGVTYIMLFGTEIFLERVWWYEEELTGHPVHYNGKEVEETSQEEFLTPKWHRGALIYIAFICVGVFLSLGALTIWHARLIARGETSIESNINKAEARKYSERGEKYLNPYDLGWRRNWRIFFGVEGLSFKESALKILLPSAHSVKGDGLTWRSLFTEDDLLLVRKSD